MSDQEDVIGEILDEVNRLNIDQGGVSEIVIHDAGLWTRLQSLAGSNLEHTSSGKKLFGIPVVLGAKSESAKFTVKTAT